MSLYARITGWIVLLFGLLYFALPLLGLAEFSLKARRVTTKVLPGDRVSVEVFPLDPTRARITSRQR